MSGEEKCGIPKIVLLQKHHSPMNNLIEDHPLYLSRLCNVGIFQAFLSFQLCLKYSRLMSTQTAKDLSLLTLPMYTCYIPSLTLCPSPSHTHRTNTHTPCTPIDTTHSVTVSALKINSQILQKIADGKMLWTYTLACIYTHIYIFYLISIASQLFIWNQIFLIVQQINTVHKLQHHAKSAWCCAIL